MAEKIKATHRKAGSCVGGYAGSNPAQKNNFALRKQKKKIKKERKDKDKADQERKDKDKADQERKDKDKDKDKGSSVLSFAFTFYDRL